MEAIWDSLGNSLTTTHGGLCYFSIPIYDVGFEQFQPVKRVAFFVEMRWYLKGPSVWTVWVKLQVILLLGVW